MARFNSARRCRAPDKIIEAVCGSAEKRKNGGQDEDRRLAHSGSDDDLRRRGICPGGTAGPAATQEEAPKPEKKICRTERLTGSLTRSSRTCLTQAQWDQVNEQNSKSINDLVQGQCQRRPDELQPPGRPIAAARGAAAPPTDSIPDSRDSLAPDDAAGAVDASMATKGRAASISRRHAAGCGCSN